MFVSDLPFQFFLDRDFRAVLNGVTKAETEVSALCTFRKSEATKTCCRLNPTGLVAFFVSSQKVRVDHVL